MHSLTCGLGRGRDDYKDEEQSAQAHTKLTVGRLLEAVNFPEGPSPPAAQPRLISLTFSVEGQKPKEPASTKATAGQTQRVN